jgi:F-type H+-transporting ATPase subunit epsilon
MLLTPREVVFEGEAKSVILPGEQGVFELLPFHKRLLSRLISGNLLIDEKVFPIQRGIVKVNQDNVTIIVEER